MKNILLSTVFAAGLGLVAIAPASAAPISTHGVIVAPAATDVACRMVEKRSTRNGVTRIVRSRECNNDYGRRSYREGYGRDRYVDRSYDRDRGYGRHDDYRRPGVSLQFGR